jgi:hypothetical protein
MSASLLVIGRPGSPGAANQLGRRQGAQPVREHGPRHSRDGGLQFAEARRPAGQHGEHAQRPACLEDREGGAAAVVEATITAAAVVGQTTGMSRVDPLTAGADAKRTAMLLRDARAVLRRLDVLAATAIASDDRAVPLIAEARETVERLVTQLGRRGQVQQRQAREAVRRIR